MNEMTPERWERIRSVLDRALDTPVDRREDVLREACGSDVALRAEVDALLEHEARACRLIETPLGEYAAELVAEMADVGPASDVTAGRQVGAYRLVRELARGGMGTVYLAERADGQFEHQVAVKLLRRGLDTDDVLRRFLAERQILASLNHANIARLVDGGATEDGRPYLVMEYVEGQRIDVYSDERRLTVEERLRLFLTVGKAVQHAHRNLVVHRDLKPGNILVSGAGEVKLLDFGIAKLLQPGAGEDTASTRTGLRLLTPAYASPEQVRGQPVTTASDVYQLGLLLYELLTGCHARPRTGPESDDSQRSGSGIEPQRPSARVADTAPLAAAATGPAAAKSIAAARRTTPERLTKRLRGDLDAITLAALRHEPEHRYPSVDALMEDIQRHLAGLPVRARDGARTYRLRRFGRRHRWAIAAAATLIVILSGYAATVHVQNTRIQAALETAIIETTRAEAISEFLVGLFEASRPERARGEEVTARDLLAHGVERADQLDDRPQLQARMLAVIGKTYHRLGLYDDAQPLYERALDLNERQLGPAHIQTAESLTDLGVLLKDRGEYAAAEPFLRRAVDLRRRLLGGEHEDLAVSVDELARLLREGGDYAAAEPLFREGLAIRRNLLGNDNHETASSINSVALLLRDLGDHEEAERLFREALAIYRRLFGDEHPWVATVKSNLALVHIEQADLTNAESLLTEALAVDRRVHGDEHPVVALRLNHLGTVFRQQGRYQEADSVLRQAVRLGRTGLGDAHPWLAVFLVNHGRVFLERGDPVAAEPALREALDIRLRSLPDDDWRMAEAEGWLGTTLAARGRLQEAEPLVRAAYTILQGGLEHGWGPSDMRIREVRALLQTYHQAGGLPVYQPTD